MGRPDGTGSRRAEDGLLRKTQTGKGKRDRKKEKRRRNREGRQRERGGGLTVWERKKHRKISLKGADTGILISWSHLYIYIYVAIFFFWVFLGIIWFHFWCLDVFIRISRSSMRDSSLLSLGSCSIPISFYILCFWDLVWDISIYALIFVLNPILKIVLTPLPRSRHL